MSELGIPSEKHRFSNTKEVREEIKALAANGETKELPRLNLLQKLAAIVAEIDNVDKRGRNEFQKYAYVKATDVAWLVRKALSSRNIYLVADVVEVLRNYEIPAREGSMQAVDVKMQFSFFDGDDLHVAPIVLHAYGTGTDKGDKAIYKAMTGALKYGLRHAFLIPDESDPEGDASVDKLTANAKKVGEEKAKAIKEGKNPPILSLFYVWNDENQTAEIVGAEELKTANKDILKQFWSNAAKAIIVTGEQLEGLKYQFEQREVPFTPLKAANG